MGDELSDEAKARKELLWGMYSDLRTHARHAETLRSNVVNAMIVVASVLIAVVANDGNVTRKDLPLCLALLVIGPLGLLFAASYTELYERNRRRAVLIRDTLETEFLGSDGPTITALLDDSDEQHEATALYRWSRRLTGSTRRFWFILPGLILLAALILTFVAW
ncbi:hypothetical protein JOD54_004914 [Actinokineospora baliensis]|uniref:hypothetical protein n=1 Tax=Actinokineospora baliensis TaxID=547056 RepID=UPI00195677E7|nr:hypothetical protein [Actinokineospora baliensis]MBM7774710.1 hypothetical protein [Actinokineospora baliensis]